MNCSTGNHTWMTKTDAAGVSQVLCATCGAIQLTASPSSSPKTIRPLLSRSPVVGSAPEGVVRPPFPPTPPVPQSARAARVEPLPNASAPPVKPRWQPAGDDGAVAQMLEAAAKELKAEMGKLDAARTTNDIAAIKARTADLQARVAKLEEQFVRIALGAIGAFEAARERASRIVAALSASPSAALLLDKMLEETATKEVLDHLVVPPPPLTVVPRVCMSCWGKGAKPAFDCECKGEGIVFAAVEKTA